MNERYGFSAGDWEAGREEAREAIIERARTESTISYSELAGRITSIRVQADSHALAALLGEISRNEHEAGRGLLSVLVVHKTGDMMPGPGFYQLAEELGEDAHDRERYWVEEFKRVTSNWTLQ